MQQGIEVKILLEFFATIQAKIVNFNGKYQNFSFKI